MVGIELDGGCVAPLPVWANAEPVVEVVVVGFDGPRLELPEAATAITTISTMIAPISRSSRR